MEFYRFFMGHDIPATNDILLMLGGAGEKKGDHPANTKSEGVTCFKEAPPHDAWAHAHHTETDGDDDDDMIIAATNGRSLDKDRVPPGDTSDSGDTGDHGHPGITRLVSQFTVPPGASRKFIKAWKELECVVRKFKGTRGFALFNVLGSNTEYMDVSAFEVPRDGKPPEEVAKAYEEYIERIEGLGVSFTTTPILNLEDLPPHLHE
jgi:hypothetical protein